MRFSVDTRHILLEWASKGKAEPLLLLPRLFWFYLAELWTLSHWMLCLCAGLIFTDFFTKGPRWVQEVPAGADGTKHPSAYVFRIVRALFFFPLPAWYGLAFQSLGCLEK